MTNVVVEVQPYGEVNEVQSHAAPDTATDHMIQSDEKEVQEALWEIVQAGVIQDMY